MKGSVHGVKLAGKDRLCMVGEVDVILLKKLELNHMKCTSQQLQHCISKVGIPALQVSNCVHKSFADSNKLSGVVPMLIVS